VPVTLATSASTSITPLPKKARQQLYAEYIGPHGYSTSDCAEAVIFFYDNGVLVSEFPLGPVRFNESFGGPFAATLEQTSFLPTFSLVRTYDGQPKIVDADKQSDNVTPFVGFYLCFPGNLYILVLNQ
jgi:hypothetical protein